MGTIASVCVCFNCLRTGYLSSNRLGNFVRHHSGADPSSSASNGMSLHGLLLLLSGALQAISSPAPQHCSIVLFSVWPVSFSKLNHHKMSLPFHSFFARHSTTEAFIHTTGKMTVLILSKQGLPEANKKLPVCSPCFAASKRIVTCRFGSTVLKVCVKCFTPALVCITALPSHVGGVQNLGLSDSGIINLPNFVESFA